MNYLSDLHTHTIVSGHAYTTLMENIDYCKKNGIKILGTSEHAPSMPGAPHYWYFGNLKILPRVINDVIILVITALAPLSPVKESGLTIPFKIVIES